MNALEFGQQLTVRGPIERWIPVLLGAMVGESARTSGVSLPLWRHKKISALAPVRLARCLTKQPRQPRQDKDKTLTCWEHPGPQYDR